MHRQPNFCPHCATPLAIASDGERERRGCQRCGWVYDPPLAVKVVVVIDHGGQILLHTAPPTLPQGAPAWAEDPAETALRLGHSAIGWPLIDPRFLGFIHLAGQPTPDQASLFLCYVVQSNGPERPLPPDVHLVRLRELPFLPAEACRYAIDAYRAWLERQG